MQIIRSVFAGIALMILLTACVTASEQDRPKILCPACGTEFEAIFQKRF